MNNKRFNVYRILTVISLLVVPLLLSFFIIVLNNYEKFTSLFKTIVLLSVVVFIVILVICFISLLKGKRIINNKHLFRKISFSLLFLIYFSEIGIMVNFVYYNDVFKEWLITSSYNSINYQDLASKIYSQYTIDNVIKDENFEKEELIDFDVDYDINMYDNKYEKEILEREEGVLYKIIKISGTTSGTGAKYVGYMAVVYDPSHVHLAKSIGAGTFEGSYGETLATIANKNNALVAINAGGFYDPNWNSNGGIPHGDVFINGKLDSTFRRGGFGGGLIGFTKDNRLVVKRMSTEEAINMGIRDAVDWDPFLIVDGKNQYENEYTYWECGRSAIAQREDGIVLLLVIDNLQKHSKGVSYKDLADILQRYGAINAANLDGGTSTSMVEKGKYINSPWNGYRPTFRWLPNAWVVTE